MSRASSYPVAHLWDDRTVDDNGIRARCFAALDVLCAQHGIDVPYRGGLDAGFRYGPTKIPFLSPQKESFTQPPRQGRRRSPSIRRGSHRMATRSWTRAISTRTGAARSINPTIVRYGSRSSSKYRSSISSLPDLVGTDLYTRTT